MCIAAWIISLKDLLPVKGCVPVEDIMPNTGNVASIARGEVALHGDLFVMDHVCVSCAVLVLRHIPMSLMPVPLLGRVDVESAAIMLAAKGVSSHQGKV